MPLRQQPGHKLLFLSRGNNKRADTFTIKFVLLNLWQISTCPQNNGNVFEPLISSTNWKNFCMWASEYLELSWRFFLKGTIFFVLQTLEFKTIHWHPAEEQRIPAQAMKTHHTYCFCATSLVNCISNILYLWCTNPTTECVVCWWHWPDASLWFRRKYEN